MEPRAPSIQTILCLALMDLGGSLWDVLCAQVCVVNLCYFLVKSPRRNAIQTSNPVIKKYFAYQTLAWFFGALADSAVAGGVYSTSLLTGHQ